MIAMKHPRRDFLVTASAAIATAQFPILGANDKINIGQVGIGGRGRDHIYFYGQLDDQCRIAAICDVDESVSAAGAGPAPAAVVEPVSWGGGVEQLSTVAANERSFHDPESSRYTEPARIF